LTVGTAGIGKETVLGLVKHSPQRVYFTGRDAKRAAGLLAETKKAAPAVSVTFLECDQSSLASVEKAAKRALSESDRLDILICNAGVAELPPSLTKDGYEMQFGINHVAHALFIKLFLPTLLRTAELPNSDARVVSVSSNAIAMAPGGTVALNDLRTTQSGLFKLARYGQSKLANILYAGELARRYPQLTSVSVHPGVVKTEGYAQLSFAVRMIGYLTNPFSMMTPAQGAENQMWAATSDKTKIANGAFYNPVGVRGAAPSKDELARQLWQWTDKELEGYNV
jgi:NAD(P)-dependent dehydrogenase (short-subunit alcohol dehydrogenase family)